MNRIMAFCVVGGHSAEVPSTDPNDLPAGWHMVRASVIPAPSGPDSNWEPGIWYADPDSAAMVLCCPDHDVVRIK